MGTTEQLLTAAETSVVSGVPLKEIYKVARERLPTDVCVSVSGRIHFTRTAAVCLWIDHMLPKDVPVQVRKSLYVKCVHNPSAEVLEHWTGALGYLFDAGAARNAVESKLADYRKALDIVVEDPAIQGGAATFKGTRILVHTIADLLKTGASPDELKADYPNLTDAMIAAAPLYARAHPKRGRPRTPTWRSSQPVSTRRYKRTTA